MPFDCATIDRVYHYGRHSRAGGNLKALALRLFISFPCFKGIHEHSVVPNQVGNDESLRPINLLKSPAIYVDL